VEAFGEEEYHGRVIVPMIEFGGFDYT